MPFAESAPDPAAGADGDQRLVELKAHGLRRAARVEECGNARKRIAPLLDLRQRQRETHRRERDEMTHARTADEEQQRHEQREQHRDREIRLERREHVEHADHDEERHESLAEVA